MVENISYFDTRKEEIVNWLINEYTSVQIRLTPSILNKISVSAYGSKTNLSYCANITQEDPKTLNVEPHDVQILESIENTLRKELPQMSITVNDKTIRVIAPELTSEKREILKKIVQERFEEAKKSVRVVREKIINKIKEQKTNKEISEDEEFAEKKKLQNMVDEMNKELDEISKRKLSDLDT